MKELKEYITEKLKLEGPQDGNKIPFLKQMKTLLWYTRVFGNKHTVYDSFVEEFKKYPGLRAACIDYINNHPDHPEMLDETTEEIIGYFKDFPADEFDKYI